MGSKLIIGGTSYDIDAIYEAWNGDLYVILKVDDIEEEDYKMGNRIAWARLYSMPEFAELGWINLNELKEAYGVRIWEVDKKNWETVNSYCKEGEDWRIEVEEKSEGLEM